VLPLVVASPKIVCFSTGLAVDIQLSSPEHTAFSISSVKSEYGTFSAKIISNNSWEHKITVVPNVMRLKKDSGFDVLRIKYKILKSDFDEGVNVPVMFESGQSTRK
jgi:hypothetical protein